MREEWFRADDGLRIRILRFRPPMPVARALCIHGLGAHAGYFEKLGTRLQARSIEVLAPDLRGHGLTGGPPSVPLSLRDLSSLVEHYGVTHLIGHSIGAGFAIRLSPAHGLPMVLLAPHVRGTEGRFSRILRRVGIWINARVRPDKEVALDGALEERLSSDPVGKAILNDPLSRRRFTYGFLDDLYSLTGKAILHAARHVRAPTLILHGERDEVSDMKGSIELLRSLGTGRKRLKPLEGLGHTFGGLISPIEMSLSEEEPVVGEVESWIRLTSRPG